MLIKNLHNFRTHCSSSSTSSPSSSLPCLPYLLQPARSCLYLPAAAAAQKQRQLSKRPEECQFATPEIRTRSKSSPSMQKKPLKTSLTRTKPMISMPKWIRLRRVANVRQLQLNPQHLFQLRARAPKVSSPTSEPSFFPEMFQFELIIALNIWTFLR